MTAIRPAVFWTQCLIEAERHAPQLNAADDILRRRHSHGTFHIAIAVFDQRAAERIDMSDLEEFTVEMNPATVSGEKATMLRELGVNRVSMGVQSWDDGLLATLGRVHSSRQAQKKL